MCIESNSSWKFDCSSGFVVKHIPTLYERKKKTFKRCQKNFPRGSKFEYLFIVDKRYVSLELVSQIQHLKQSVFKHEVVVN